MTVAGVGGEILGPEPNLDLGLMVVTRLMDLPPGAALTLLALGRTIGWIGHAIEQYATGRLIRPGRGTWEWHRTPRVLPTAHRDRSPIDGGS